MSRWQEFGFPDLRLIDPRTALTGLELALIERDADMTIPHVADWCLIGKSTVWRDVLWSVDLWGSSYALFDYGDPAIGHDELLSNWSRHNFRQANYPEILGEQRVFPAGKLEPVFHREFFLQLYRIINLAYKQVRYDADRQPYIVDRSAELEFLDL